MQQQYQGAQPYHPPQHQQQHQAPPSLQQGYPPQQHQPPHGYPPPQQQHQQGYAPPQHHHHQQQQQGYMPPPPPQHQQQMGNYPPQQHQQPPQQQHQQQRPQPAVLVINYLDGDCCQCVDCCGCWNLQPSRRSGLSVSIDGKEVGTISQGSHSEYMLNPGNHRVEITESGVISGFLSSIGLASKAGAGVVAMAGQTVNMEMGWKHGSGSKFYPYLINARSKD